MLPVHGQAEKAMLESEENKEYLPIQGLEAFNKATAELLLGKDHPAIKVQGSPALRTLTAASHLRLCELACNTGRAGKEPGPYMASATEEAGMSETGCQPVSWGQVMS